MRPDERALHALSSAPAALVEALMLCLSVRLRLGRQLAGMAGMVALFSPPSPFAPAASRFSLAIAGIAVADLVSPAAVAAS